MTQKIIKGIEAFDEVKRLIVVAAHPDDLETMCGGTIYMLAQRGVEIFSVNCTLGDIGSNDRKYTRESLAAVRQRETETAAHLLSIKQSFNLGHHDGELLPDLTLRAQIAELYRRTQADTLFTFDPFWTGQIHPDHIAASQAALDAYMPSKMFLYRTEQLEAPDIKVGCLERVFLFGTGWDRDPDIFVDVAPVYDKKIEAAKAHVSQFPKGEADLEWMKDRDREHGRDMDSEFAEQFRQMMVW